MSQGSKPSGKVDVKDQEFMGVQHKIFIVSIYDDLTVEEAMMAEDVLSSILPYILKGVRAL